MIAQNFFFHFAPRHHFARDFQQRRNRQGRDPVQLSCHDSRSDPGQHIGEARDVEQPGSRIGISGACNNT